ncbi:MAG: hypothetical protein J7L15_02280 [Clostridiales bacterium]|nr:hypothetical protein [Clostridiales bacterium]
MIEKLNELRDAYMDILKMEANIGCPATGCQGVVGKLAELEGVFLTGYDLAAPGQYGYDLVSKYGDTLSVKATASIGTTKIHINPRTCHLADDTMVFEFYDNIFTPIYYGTTEFLLQYCGFNKSKNKHTLSRKNAKLAWEEFLSLN